MNVNEASEIFMPRVVERLLATGIKYYIEYSFDFRMQRVNGSHRCYYVPHREGKRETM